MHTEMSMQARTYAFGYAHTCRHAKTQTDAKSREKAKMTFLPIPVQVGGGKGPQHMEENRGYKRIRHVHLTDKSLR